MGGRQVFNELPASPHFAGSLKFFIKNYWWKSRPTTQKVGGLRHYSAAVPLKLPLHSGVSQGAFQGHAPNTELKLK